MYTLYRVASQYTVHVYAVVECLPVKVVLHDTQPLVQQNALVCASTEFAARRCTEYVACCPRNMNSVLRCSGGTAHEGGGCGQ